MIAKFEILDIQNSNSGHQKLEFSKSKTVVLDIIIHFVFRISGTGNMDIQNSNFRYLKFCCNSGYLKFDFRISKILISNI
jgi:hypothetical protein